MNPKKELAMIRALTRTPYPECKPMDLKAALASTTLRTPAGAPHVQAWTFDNQKGARFATFTERDLRGPKSTRVYTNATQALMMYRNDLAERASKRLLELDEQIARLQQSAAEATTEQTTEAT